MTGLVDPSSSKGELVRHWLEQRWLPSQFLRCRVSPELVLSHSILGLAVFLLHWEEAYHRIGFDFVLMPWVRMPEAWQLWAWVPALLAMPINSWWLHRWIGRETGTDHHFRRPILFARQVLCALPGLGLLAIPSWYWLQKEWPRWAARPQVPRELRLTGNEEACDGKPRHREAELSTKTRGSAIWVFLIWIIAANLLILRATVVGLAALKVPVLDLFVLVSIVGLRILGFGLSLAYARLFYEKRGLAKADLVLHSLLALGWLLPFPLLFFGTLLLQELFEESKERSMAKLGRQRGNLPKLESVRAKIPPHWRWMLPKRPGAPEPKVTSQMKIWRRLKLSTYFFEVALLVVLFVSVPQGQLPLSWLWVILFVLLMFFSITGAIWVLGASVVNLGNSLGMTNNRSEWVGAGGYQFFASLVFLGGLLLGVSWIQGAFAAGKMLEYIGMFGVLISVLLRLPGILAGSLGKSVPRYSLVAWYSFYQVLWVGGIWLRKGDPMVIVIPAILAFQYVRMVRRVPWLIRPFRLGDIWKSAIPLRVRCRLLGILGLGLIPLTGSWISLVWVGRRSLEREFDIFWSANGKPALPINSRGLR